MAMSVAAMSVAAMSVAAMEGGRSILNGEISLECRQWSFSEQSVQGALRCFFHLRKIDYVAQYLALLSTKVLKNSFDCYN